MIKSALGNRLITVWTANLEIEISNSGSSSGSRSSVAICGIEISV